MRRSMYRIALTVVGALLLSPLSGDAQIGDRIRRQVQDAARTAGDAVRGADDAVDRLLARAECRIDDRACIERAQRDGVPVRVTDASGQEVPGGAAASLRPGDGAWDNYDFVPGARILFAEDLAAERVGNFPRRLQHIQGNLEVVEWQNRRWLRASSKSAFAIPLGENLPDRFTMELDVTLPGGGMVVYFAPREGISDRFLFNGSWPHPFVVLSGSEVGVRERPHNGGSVMEPAAVLGLRDVYGELVRLRIHADGNYLKVYLNERRVANLPNVDFPRTDRVFIEVTGSPPGEPRSPELIPTFIGDIAIHGEAEPLYEALSGEGRVVTQGILFDVGSERIRPESTPTLREIGEMMRRHADLRILIEGHTDDTGDAQLNQALSERRAAAVRQFLIDSLGVEPSRLEARGLGPSRPVEANDTAEGRQANRRVELVRL